MVLEDFGRRLVFERERLGFKAVDVYTALNIHRNSQSQYERGIKEPGISYLAGLMTLGFDVVWLLSGESTDRSIDVLNDDERTLLSAYRGLLPPARTLVIQVSQGLKKDEPHVSGPSGLS
jgi:transcriptional regulator with XRE-family HTH domain